MQTAIEKNTLSNMNEQIRNNALSDSICLLARCDSWTRTNTKASSRTNMSTRGWNLPRDRPICQSIHVTSQTANFERLQAEVEVHKAKNDQSSVQPIGPLSAEVSLLHCHPHQQLCQKDEDKKSQGRQGFRSLLSHFQIKSDTINKSEG